MFRQSTFLWIVIFLVAAGPVPARGAEKLDWRAWQQLPVFDQGRLMPLDTFARSKVLLICGRSSPTLSLPGALSRSTADSATIAQARLLFPDGKPRKFDPAELLFSWLVEPEKWGHVPILSAENQRLRKEILDLPSYDKQGRRLRYISVWRFDHTDEIFRRWEQTRQRAEQGGGKSQLAGLQRKLRELGDAYTAYHRVTFDPFNRGDNPTRFFGRFHAMRQSFKTLTDELQRTNHAAPSAQLTRLLTEAARAIDELGTASARPEFSIHDVEPAAAACRRAALAIQAHYADRKDTDRKDAVPAFIADDLVRQTTEMHFGLYDNGSALRFVPALNPGALESDRLPEDDAQPWLSFQALLNGSQDLLQGYPESEVRQVRQALKRVKAAYLDRPNPKRPQRFSAAMNEFAAAVRVLGEKVTGLRPEIPIRRSDAELLAATAYPPPGFARVEVFYNRLNPFFWSWLVALGALLCLAVSFGVIRTPMFWGGIALMLFAQAMIVVGFALRTYITGLVPLTGMFETVVFVALCVAMLGVWFTLLPLNWPGLSAAWRLTAVPLARGAPPLGEAELSLFNPKSWSAASWALLLPRACLTLWAFIKLARTPQLLADGYFNLLPRTDIGSSVPTVSNLVVWLVGLCVLLLGVYLLPRLILALLLSIAVIPYALARQGIAERLQQVFARKPFALVGAAVAFLVALLAYYAPSTVINKEITSAVPVLRDNFWLFVHVVTITASYGAGAMAWGLSNIALAYYLFGRYRPSGKSPTSLAPEPCASLAGFTYKATQVAVLLLAAGTILGALWADVAWGRFWSWDAKEVWSLITLLIYLLILHGRHIGWFGNFGLAVGSVLGFTSIVMAWYGVNFVLNSGLHSYGSGSGGQIYVGIVMACNWLFLFVAAVRYSIEKSTVAAAA